MQGRTISGSSEPLRLQSNPQYSTSPHNSSDGALFQEHFSVQPFGPLATPKLGQVLALHAGRCVRLPRMHLLFPRPLSRVVC